MLKIGITGGIGSGKTIVCRIFALLGVPIYDSDFRAKWVMHHDQWLRQELVKTFGEKAYTPGGDLDRPYLASLVFNQPAKLALLNSLVHPRVKDDFTNWVAAHQNYPYILKEAALMYESNAYKQVTKVITVSAPLEIRITRVLQRDAHRQPAEVQAIIDKQLPEEERQQRADYIIYNDDQQPVIPQVLALHQKLLDLNRQSASVSR
ncbi:dephospho-CoA kinase [Adhaeribacter aerolatus]|uniref:Dephospho-CoA kinase n=1 Tax=Adhaeribacter aerolatus TaxID=670289 RepID=A0A512AUM7_9BACT|nr:dephospho-CoA kinase [Adhaeribacter aerolatus]GEO03390.1 dephospho-CoA kinase [Adhaeribacter aerolatus]